jgi:hypothetical protein
MTTFAPQLRSALEGSLAALQRLADSQLPSAIERRMQQLGERTETLSEAERDEYAGLVEFWRQRILEKAEAATALQRIREAAPDLGVGQ